MGKVEALCQDIVDIHVDIEKWFRGELSSDRLTALMTRFSSDFSMITTKGIALGKDDVRHMFAANHGKRPALRIHVENIDVVTVWKTGALLTYQETHREGAASSTVRRSTVALTISEKGPLYWRHLHETFIL